MTDFLKNFEKYDYFLLRFYNYCNGLRCWDIDNNEIKSSTLLFEYVLLSKTLIPNIIDKCSKLDDYEKLKLTLTIDSAYCDLLLCVHNEEGIKLFTIDLSRFKNRIIMEVYSFMYNKSNPYHDILSYYDGILFGTIPNKTKIKTISMQCIKLVQDRLNLL